MAFVYNIISTIYLIFWIAFTYLSYMAKNKYKKEKNYIKISQSTTLIFC